MRNSVRAYLPPHLRCAIAVPFAFLANVELIRPASAHVKWFCAYNVAGQPVGLENVLCPNFEFLTGLSILALTAGAVLEDTPVGSAVLRAIDTLTGVLRHNIETVFRASVAFFFVSIWAAGGILLTPELKTSSQLVAAIQLGIAAGMLSRRTMPLSAFGICLLYAIAVWKYGFFHLADYPVFLGVAAYLALVGLQTNFFGARPIDILRWAAGITLMWASIEKWAYPEWSYPLFIKHPGMTLGFAPDFYMQAAGAVEFALAFSLMWTPLVRRIGAVILAMMFVSAVFEFGKIDLIGHTLIVAAFLGIIADDGGKPARLRDCCLVPFSYASSLAGFLMVYYVMHKMLFGTSIL
jgi:small basic protein